MSIIKIPNYDEQHMNAEFFYNAEDYIKKYSENLINIKAKEDFFEITCVISSDQSNTQYIAQNIYLNKKIIY